VAAPHHPALAPQVVIRGIPEKYVMLFFRTMVDVYFSITQTEKMGLHHNKRDSTQILLSMLYEETEKKMRSTAQQTVNKPPVYPSIQRKHL
jgi:hypothetical protein